MAIIDHMTTQCGHIQHMLRRVGYSCQVHGNHDTQTKRSLSAFQRDLRLPVQPQVDDRCLTTLTTCYRNCSRGEVHANS